MENPQQIDDLLEVALFEDTSILRVCIILDASMTMTMTIVSSWKAQISREKVLM